MRRLLMGLGASFLIAGAFAQASEEASMFPHSVSECEEAITTFQDVSRIGRKDGAARNITQRHQKMAADGWRFADMEVYTENGDLEGFYLSYTRSVPCPAEQD